MFKKVEYYIKEKKYDKALNCLLKLEDDFKKTNKFLLLIAHVQYGCDNYREATKCYKNIFSKDIQTARAYAEYSQILLKIDKDENAKKILLQGIEKFPENISFKRVLINLLMKDKIYESALELAYELLRQDEKNVISHKLVINILLKKKKYIRAENVLENAIKLFSEVDFLKEIIQYFIEIKDYFSALEKYKLMTSIDPNNYTNYVGQYRMYIYLDNIEAAESILLNAVQYADNKDSLYIHLANIYYKSNKYKKAIQYFKLSILRNPLDLNTLKKMIRIYIVTNNYKLALQCIHRTQKICADDSEIAIEYGIVEMKLCNFSKARSIFKNISSDSLGYKKAQVYLFVIDEEEIRRDIEIKKYEELKVNIPHTISDYHCMIEMEYHYDGISEAIKLCKKSLKNNNDIVTFAKLVILYLKNNNLNLAYKIWFKILKENNNNIALFYILRNPELYFIENKELLELKEQSIEKISLKSKYKEKYNIAILGGSNTIMLDGWSTSFRQNLSIFSNIKIDNYGLGGISSLYGLFIAKEKKLYQKYDTIIFEYTLNDIYFNYFNGYNHLLLESVLNAFVNEANKFNTRIIFILMAPLDNVERLSINNCSISNIYKNVASKNANVFLFDIYDIIKSKNFSSAKFIEMLYRDNMHYSSFFAKDIADMFSFYFLNDIFINTLCMDAPSYTKDLVDMSKMELIRPESFKVSGKSLNIKRETKIMNENFLRIDTDAYITVEIPQGKCVLALLINSSEYTGYIKVGFGDTVFIKNIFAERPINDSIKPRVYLKQFTQPLLSFNKKTLLTLSAHVTINDFEDLDLDTTIYNHEPKVTLEKQELEIAGILII